MPTISMFFGIIIRMFYRDNQQHHLPHIHADYQSLFKKIRNGGYFVEWDNEADLSADTLYIEGSSL